MIAQAFERVIYRNKDYPLMGGPLEAYIEKHKDIKFEMATAYCRGYQGYWLIENNQLYLTKIESTNYSLLDLFGTTEPVFAEWYSGTLSIGIGKSFHFNPFYPFPNKSFSAHKFGIDSYENYVQIKIEKGTIIEKKIIKGQYQYPKFEFGKYNGREIRDVINGKIAENTYTTIKNFIEDLVEGLSNKECDYNILCHSFKLTEDDKSLIQDMRNRCNKVEFFITKDYIAISSKTFSEYSTNDDIAEKASKLLEKILTSNFKHLVGFSENSILINSDVQYVAWAILNVDVFAIPSFYLEKDLSLKTLKTFKINRLNPFVFEHTPIIETVKCAFAKELIKLNQDKFEKINNVVYDLKSNKYTYNLSEKEMRERFGYFLYEDYEEEGNIDSEYDDEDYNHRQWSEDELEMGDWNYDPWNPAHDPDENPWIDVFGAGEEAEDAYWNTD